MEEVLKGGSPITATVVLRFNTKSMRVSTKSSQRC